MARLVPCAWCLLIPLSEDRANAALSFELTAGPGLSASPDAAAIMSGVATAASKWSGIISDSVVLKYTIDYDAGLPALGAAFDVYDPKPYSAVKPALIGKASSPYDFMAIAALQPGPALTLWINDLMDGPSFPPKLDADGSINNSFIDISRAQLKGLGLLPGGDGGPGADGTIKIGSAAFDFDPSDGITPGKYDFVGVAMHEIAHSLGFISGVDTLTTLLPPTPFSPPGPRDATEMVTVLDLYRYSTDSKAAGPLVPDLSLPVPGFSSTRIFSLDGGTTPLEMFSTGKGLAGDMKQAGHWKDDPTFGLMDPELAAGFALTAAFEASLTGPMPPPDVVALDVIGWTIAIVPEASSLMFGAMACGVFGMIYGGRWLRRHGGPPS